MNALAIAKSFANRICKWGSLLSLLTLQFGAPLSYAQQPSYTFAVVPQFDQRKLFSVWQPIVDEISRRTGYSIKLVATLTVPDFERELAKGSFDFVYANPYHILREAPRQGYIPLVRDQQALRGILVVNRDSSIKTPEDLDGQKLAVPSLNALGASLLLRADLEQIFHAKITPINVKTHSSVYLQVANGLIPAGGGVEKTLREQDPSVQSLLRVLYTTREMPSHPIAAHPRLAPQVRQTLQKALLELAATEEGKKLLQHVPMTEAVSTSMQDYAPMKKWGLETYWVD